ncbi:MAG: SET domain-containing protein [Acidimicrobiales bacterium]
MNRVVSSYISPKARKGSPSRIEGRGLFAADSIDAGEVVAVKGGHLVATRELLELPEHLQNSEIQVAEGLHLVALTEEEYEPVMLFINHSCAPNVGFAGNIVLVAIRDVSAGEELTIDYAMFDMSPDAMECHCGAPSCRGTIAGTDWRSGELQTRYDGYFSSYLQLRIKASGP